MALSNTENKTKDDLFSCPVCLETLKSPKILPCLHTFCEQCIHECILATGRNMENEVTEFACPVCQTVVKPNVKQGGIPIDKWAAGLQTNHVLLTMIAVAKGNNEQECHLCRRHDLMSSAKYWCKECAEAFCEECNSKHDWVKFGSNHCVIPIEDVGHKTSGIDLNAISNKCLEHPGKNVDCYCFDHKTLCCIQCFINYHKGCGNVKTIEEISDGHGKLLVIDALTSMKDAAIALMESKKQQLNTFNLKIENTEETAANLVLMLKGKLDNLFKAFSKQLHIFRDEKTAILEIRIQSLLQFIDNLDHWIHKSKVTNEFGTKTQQLIFSEMIKRQIVEAVVEQLYKNCINDKSCDVKFCENKLLQQVKTIDNIGTFKGTEQKLKDEMRGILKIGRTFDITISPTFDEIIVRKVNSYCLRGTQITCGVAVHNSRYMILGDAQPKKKLHVFDKLAGSISSTTELNGDVKRVCYVEKTNQIFVSCYCNEVYRAVLREKVISNPELIFNSDFVGALCPYENHVYIVVNNAIKTFNQGANQNKMTLCFETNTDTGLNGIDIFERKLICTATTNEIKCATFKGEEVFCFKDRTLGDPNGLAVLPSGLVLIINQENKGSLHVLSKDGKKLKTVLEKFDDITKPEDIWLDTDEEIIYIGGGEYIEVYRITSC